MAQLTAADGQQFRHGVAGDVSALPWTKAQLVAAAQAIEDTFTSIAFQNALSSAIDTALAPATATAAQKRIMVKYWLRSRYERGN